MDRTTITTSTITIMGIISQKSKGSRRKPIKDQGGRNKGKVISIGFENLDVWQRSVALSVEIYKHFRESKDFGFKDQITRSSLSIPSNISEGYERKSIKEKNHFYSIAKGSAGELRTQILVGLKIDYINEEKGKVWLKEAKEFSSMLSGLISSNNKKALSNNA